jgi:hypothetical protein
MVIVLGLAGCRSSETTDQRHQDANTPAGKAGQAAYKVAQEADKAGRVLGQKLEKAAHDAHEGWKEAQSRDRKHE